MVRSCWPPSSRKRILGQTTIRSENAAALELGVVRCRCDYKTALRQSAADREIMGSRQRRRVVRHALLTLPPARTAASQSHSRTERPSAPSYLPVQQPPTRALHPSAACVPTPHCPHQTRPSPS